MADTRQAALPYVNNGARYFHRRRAVWGTISTARNLTNT